MKMNMIRLDRGDEHGQDRSVFPTVPPVVPDFASIFNLIVKRHLGGSLLDTYADITLFADVALTMLKMMGHSTTVPGAILAADVPAALSWLTAAIDAENALLPIEDKDADEPVVSMAHRALPLIDLLAAAARAESNVMWK